MANTVDIYQNILMMMMRSKRVMLDVTEKYSMTPVQGMLLMLFEPGEGISMQSLSAKMACDASNMTGLIDRLDAQNLIIREPSPNDRRIKCIKLSDKGVERRAEILQGLRDSAQLDMDLLNDAERKSFNDIVNKLTATVS